MQPKDFIKNAGKYFQEFCSYVQKTKDQEIKLNIHFSLFSCCGPDHLGYRCSSHEEYDELIEYLITQEIITEIHREKIGEREISLVKLCIKATNDVGGNFSYIEICDQKPDNSQVFGFDHFELVYMKPTEHTVFSKTDTYKYFKKEGKLSKKKRPNYRYQLYEINTGVFGKIIISQELLWDIALKSNPSGHVVF